MKIAILDDFQRIALSSADWSGVTDLGTVKVFDTHLGDEAAVIAALQPFEVVVAMRERTRFPASVLERLPNLKLLVTTGSRNAAIDVAAADRHGVTVCGTQSLHHPPAELAWAMMLALARNLVFEHNAMRAGHWQTTVGADLHGSTLGVLGLGKHGARVASIGKAFGMNVVAWSQNLTADRTAEVGVDLVTKEQLFERSDFLTVHLILGDRTRGLVDADSLRQMKPTAYLVNTSRGPIVDPTALRTALEEGWIAGAGVDVYDEEPVPPDNPIRALPNLLLTPHIGYVTRRNYSTFYTEAVEDIVAWSHGEPVRRLGS